MFQQQKYVELYLVVDNRVVRLKSHLRKCLRHMISVTVNLFMYYMECT